MRIVLTPHAVSDVEQASAYYASIDTKLGARFAEDVDTALERIVMFPSGAPAAEGFGRLRRARMRRFPYGIFYQQTPAGDVLVVRVLHSRRHQAGALEGSTS